jgi:hypothetical protein
LGAIPIAVFMIIDAGTASSSPFQRTPKIDPPSRWNRVLVPLESAFTTVNTAPECARNQNFCRFASDRGMPWQMI